MSTEEYDELYAKGFDEGVTDVEETEVKEEAIEEEGEGLEQPETEEEVETETQTDEEEQETTEDEEEDSVTEPEKEVFTIKHNGVDMTLSKEEMLMLANKGFDYTSKTQDLSTKRHRLEMLDGMSDEDLQSFVDASKGNKEAFATIANKANIDPYDVDGTGEYKPSVVQKNYALDDVVESIKADTTNSPTIDGWINALPSRATELFTKDPLVLADIHKETQNGIAQKVMPEVIKSMALNPMMDFKQAYLTEREKVVSDDTTSKEEVSREVKKKATIAKKSPSKHKAEHTDIWEDDDLYAKMQEMRKRY